MRRLLCVCFLVFLLLPVAAAQTSREDLLLIRGQVLDDQGRPVSGANVTASPDGGLRGKVPSATSDSRGEFSISVYKADSYKVSASKTADGYPSTINPFYYPAEDAFAHVRVLEGQVPFATIRFGSKAGNIAVRVVDAETYKVIEDFQITLCRAEFPKYCHRQSTRSSGGHFRVLVPPAPFTVQISAAGYEDWYETDNADQQLAPVQVSSGTTNALAVSMVRVFPSADGANSVRLPSPQPLLPPNGAEFTHYPRRTRLEWSPVAGAASYTVELEVCAIGSGKECGLLLQLRGNPPLSGIEGTSYEFLFIGSQPGRWRVWAVDAKGRVGVKSGWSQFFYR